MNTIKKKHFNRQNIYPILFFLFFLLFTADAPKAQAAGSLEDGEYAIELTMTGGSGKASVQTPALLTVRDGTACAKLIWSSSNYDYMIVNGKKYLNESEENANSSFTVPIEKFDEDLPVLADTLAMGTPHEIEYILHFYSDTIDSKSSLPQEGAKRVLFMAAVIIVGGAILNHIVQSRRKKDYTGTR